MILLPHTALLALILSLLGYPPLLPTTAATRHSTCHSLDHPAAYFDTCAAYYNTSSNRTPLFGSVESLNGNSAFAIIQAAAPPSPPLPTFSSLPFLPPPTHSTSSPSNSSLYHLLLLHTSTDPFSLHLLPHFHVLARRFPHVRFLAVDCSGEDVYAFHRLINTSVTQPFPFISPSPPAHSTADVTALSASASWWSMPSRLRSLLSLSSWWSSAPPLPPPAVTAPSLSFSSHYLVRGLPTLLLFHSSTVQQPNSRWPRSLTQLTQHIAHATNQQPETVDERAEDEEEEVVVVGGEAADVSEGEDDVDEEEWSELDEMFGATSELEYGLLFGVLGMSVVHWLHMFKDKLDRWEVEALAGQHMAI